MRVRCSTIVPLILSGFGQLVLITTASRHNAGIERALAFVTAPTGLVPGFRLRLRSVRSSEHRVTIGPQDGLPEVSTTAVVVDGFRKRPRSWNLSHDGVRSAARHPGMFYYHDRGTVDAHRTPASRSRHGYEAIGRGLGARVRFHPALERRADCGRPLGQGGGQDSGHGRKR